MAGPDAGRTVIYAVTPMGMCVSAEGMTFLARRIVVHTDGRDAEAEARAATVVRQLAYHRAVAANHPSARIRKWSERKSWRLARRVGTGDHALGTRLLDVQRERVTAGADAALAGMFTTPTDAPALPVGDPIGPEPTVSANTEEYTTTERIRSTAEQPESTPVTITLTRLPMPDPIPADAGKSTLPLKPIPALPAPVDSTPAPITERPSVAAESTRPRRVTYKVPEAAKAPRTRRTAEQLLSEARTVTADWPDAKVTAEGIRRELRVSPVNARKLRDALLAERAA